MMGKYLTGSAIFLLFAGDVFADTPQLHPLEQYCVTRASSGMMVGEIVECSCEWGRMRYEIQDIHMKVGTLVIPSRQHLIQNGSRITVFDPETRHGTVIEVPNYQEFLDSAEGKDAMENMQAFMESSGSEFTDKSKEIAGEECKVVTNSVVGDICISEDGIILEMIGADGTMVQLATSLDKDTCGDMSNYEVPADVVIGEVPDMSSIFEQLEQMQKELPSQ